MKWPLFFLVSSLAAAPLPPADNAQVGVQNAVLTEVNGHPITVLDVKKKMDLTFLRNYPQFEHSNQARFEFYRSIWRSVLQEMVDGELILSHAEEKELPVSDGEVREEMERRYGPNITVTLDKINLSYDEAWKVVRQEIIIERMMWIFAQNRALQLVTPDTIRDAYSAYLKQNPSYTELRYRVLTLNEGAAAADVLAELTQPPETLALKGATLSTEYVARLDALSDAHRAALAPLEVGQYSGAATTSSRTSQKPVTRIFYLAAREEHPARSFEEMTPILRNQLTHKAMTKCGEEYLGKLRTRFGYDPNSLKETVPDTLEPFSIQY